MKPDDLSYYDLLKAYCDVLHRQARTQQPPAKLTEKVWRKEYE